MSDQGQLVFVDRDSIKQLLATAHKVEGGIRISSKHYDGQFSAVIVNFKKKGSQTNSADDPAFVPVEVNDIQNEIIDICIVLNDTMEVKIFRKIYR